MNNSPSRENPTEHLINDTVREFADDIALLESKRKRRHAKSYLADGSVKEHKKPSPSKQRSPRPVKKPLVQESIAAPLESPDILAVKPATSTSSFLKDYKDDGDLPDNYQTTHVRLLPRDPYHVFAYWEIDGSSVDKLKNSLGDRFHGAVYTLRVYDVTLIDFNGSNANSFFDLDELYMKRRYLRVPNDNASYCAEIGVRLPSGEFFAFCRSNTAYTQPANESWRGDLLWKEVQIDKQQQAYAVVDLQKSKIKQFKRINSNFQFNLSKVTISGEDIRLFYEKGMALKDIVLNHLRESLPAKDAHLIESIELEDVTIDKSSTQAFKYKNLFRGGSEAVLKEHAGASEGMFFREVKVRKKKDFPFKIEMELTVKGKMLADAQVTLGKQPVKLDKDGSFTMKFHLNDGLLPFDFLDRSSDKDLEKRISTSVIRTQTQGDRTP